jgi:predicted DNA-binding protein
VPKDLHRRAKATAAARGHKLSDIVRTALDDYIEEMGDSELLNQVEARIAEGKEQVYSHEDMGEARSTAFWTPKTLEELTAAQSAPVVTDVRALATGFWPEDESADDINSYLAQQRTRDRLRDA